VTCPSKLGRTRTRHTSRGSNALYVYYFTDAWNLLLLTNMAENQRERKAQVQIMADVV
jgi:hypothetical protein